MPKGKEPKLCPDCPMKGWVEEAKRRIRERGYKLNFNNEASNLKLCMELRRISKEKWLAPCPHFPESESMEHYL